MAIHDSARASAGDLRHLFSATSDATVVDGDQSGRYAVSVTFGGRNDEELQTVATTAFRSHGFRNLTADDVRTLAAITRWKSFGGRIGSSDTEAGSYFAQKTPPLLRL